MKALLCSPSSPVFLRNPPPCNPRTPPILPTAIQNPHRPSNSPWQLQANAKGFSGSSSGGPKQRAVDRNPNNNEDDEQIPMVVFKRMIARILVSVGLPLAVGLALLKYFGAAKEQGWDVPLWLAFSTTLITFAASTLGVAYGALSSSWDPERAGSVLGLEEAQENWVEIWKEENND
ncbi:hypothetical protein SLE2022_402650 [Rubroshorea leprosula]